MATSIPASAPLPTPVPASSPTLGLYVCTIGAAAAITIFDGVQNQSRAAIAKTGGWFSKVCAGGDQAAIWFLCALLFFCLFAGLVAFAYRPRENKEAFILGAGILAMLNALIASPQTPEGKKGAMNSAGVFLPLRSPKERPRHSQSIPMSGS